MSSANVNEIHALDELRTALMRFKSEAQNALNAAAFEINRTRNWLQERLSYWQNELKRRRRALEEAIAALAACEALAQDAASIVCSPLQVKVLQARRRVEEAENELRTVQVFIKRTEEASASYERQARQLTTVLDNDLLKASALLSRSTSILLSYAAESSSVSTGSSYSPVISTASTSSISSSAAAEIGNGMQMVSIADIDFSDSHVKNAGDFIKGISPDEMEEGLRKLQDVVIPAIAKGADADYFSQLDVSLGLENANGYSHIYHVFYDDTACIRLDKVGDKYLVNNGYHRLFIAQKLGITTLPALVFSRQP